MESLQLNIENAWVSEDEIQSCKDRLIDAHKRLHSGRDNYTGWVDYPIRYDHNEIDSINQIAEKIRCQCEVFIVIGIGGSYLGARAAVEMLSNTFYNLSDLKERKYPWIFFAGNNISGTYHNELLEAVKDKEISICVISKSGTTTESNIAFSLFKKLLQEKYGESASERIYVITDKEKGILREETKDKGYTNFIVPDDIGGRYSVLTPVGLLPIAVSGIDIKEMLKGAGDACRQYYHFDLKDNPCCQYAAVRNILYERGKVIEVFEAYEPKFQYFAEWIKQLFGESEGKEGKGIFPVYLQFSTDLHSMGQFLQEGNQIFFETVLNAKNLDRDITIPEGSLDMFQGKSMNDINVKAMEGVLLAHIEDEIPNLRIDIPELSSYYFGQMVYFFEKSCALSGYLLNVNPFDQPGVEKYKRNMRELIE